MGSLHIFRPERPPEREKTALSGGLQAVEKPCLKEKSPFLQGEYEGAGAPSCWIECLQKACVSRRLRRAAAAFRPDARAEKRGIVKPVKKVQRTFSTG